MTPNTSNYTGNITDHFRWDEFESSAKALELSIDNCIPDEIIASQIRSLTVTILEPLRRALGKPITINSGYRCTALNKALKGAPLSQHTKGQAADIATDNPAELAKLVIKLGLPFDQLILYPTFIHISHKHPGPQRSQILYDKTYKGERL